MNNVTIQLASEDDLAEILPFVCAYHEFEELNLTDIERERSVRTLLSDRLLGGIWLVHVDVEPVGYIALCFGYSIEFAGQDAFVDEFYIHPKFRDKGIGTKVLELIKEEAIKMNIRALHLEVARSNRKAQGLYSRAHFKAREKYVIMSVNL